MENFTKKESLSTDIEEAVEESKLKLKVLRDDIEMRGIGKSKEERDINKKIKTIERTIGSGLDFNGTVRVDGEESKLNHLNVEKIGDVTEIYVKYVKTSPKIDNVHYCIRYDRDNKTFEYKNMERINKEKIKNIFGKKDNDSSRTELDITTGKKYLLSIQDRADAISNAIDNDKEREKEREKERKRKAKDKGKRRRQSRGLPF